MNRRPAWTLIAALLSALFFVACDSDSNAGTEDSDNPVDTDPASSSDSDSDTAGDSDTPAADKNDVCGFTDPVTNGDVEADGMVSIPANHPYIIYYGRVDCAEETAPSFSFPGVSIRMKFTGTSLDMRLEDNGTGVSPDSNNYYGVIIDDGEMQKVETLPSQKNYELARGLSQGEHTVEVFKLIESSPVGRANQGKGVFLGFRVDADAEIRPLATRRRRVEFIGDSITCGYGSEELVSYADISANPADYTYTTANSNAWLAWGAVSARALDAEYMAVAYSGRGMVRNFGGAASPTLPQIYLKTLPDDPSASPWDTADAVPDLVVVNLGTNDFSAGLTLDNIEDMQEQYRDTYEVFLTTLREYYPDSVIIAAVGTMMSDYYPVGLNVWTRIQTDVAEVVKRRNDAGDGDVHILVMPPQTEPYGEDYHPSAATHAAMATALVNRVGELNVF